MPGEDEGGDADQDEQRGKVVAAPESETCPETDTMAARGDAGLLLTCYTPIIVPIIDA